jgi:hypothetical protein
MCPQTSPAMQEREMNDVRLQCLVAFGGIIVKVNHKRAE